MVYFRKVWNWSIKNKINPKELNKKHNTSSSINRPQLKEAIMHKRQKCTSMEWIKTITDSKSSENSNRHRTSDNKGENLQ